MTKIWTVVPGLPEESQVLYAGVADAGIFVSRDSGQSWEELTGLTRHSTRDEWQPGAGGLCCHTILLDPNNKDRLWVGISAVGIFRSDDNGKTWETKTSGLEMTVESKTRKDIGSCIHRVVLDPKNPERLFQQNHAGVFRSTNAGDSWERIENGLPGTFGFPMVMHPRNSDTLYTVSQESDEYRYAKNGELAVYRTTDSGDSWQPLRNGLPDAAYVGVLRQAMAADTLDPAGIYFGTTGGTIFYSRDEGAQWHAMPCALPRIKCITAVLVD